MTENTSGHRLEVTHVLWRLSQGGGVQTVVRMLVRAVPADAAHVTVVTARPLIAEDRLDELPVVVHPLGHGGARLRPWHRVRLVLGVARALRRRRPDVVQLHSGTVWLGLLAPLAVRRAGRVVEVHDAPGSGRHSALTDRLEGWWVRLSRATVVCHSTSVATEVFERWKVPSRRLTVLPLAVDLERFAGGPCPEARQELGLAPSDVVLVAVGRLVASKRYDLAVDAVARLARDTALVLVGDGPERAELERRVTALCLADRVVFAGTRYGDDLSRVVRAADVLVSTSEYEGFGLTLVEGMAAGLPVVATAVGGVTDIVVDGVTGTLVPPGDLPSLVGALDELVRDPARRRQFGAAGFRRAAEAFGPATLAEGFLDVYRSVAR